MRIFNEKTEWIFGIIACAVILYVAYLSGNIAREFPLSVPILSLTLCLVSILIVLLPVFKNISRQTKIFIVTGALVLSAFTNLVFLDDDSFHTEPLICNLFVRGHIKSEDVEKESDDGEEYTVTQYRFISASPKDDIAKNLVDLALLEISVGSILFPYFLLRYKLNVSFK
jgi:hypothetical protein